jgi:hypothetical protein
MAKEATKRTWFIFKIGNASMEYRAACISLRYLKAQRFKVSTSKHKRHQSLAVAHNNSYHQGPGQELLTLDIYTPCLLLWILGECEQIDGKPIF